MNAEQQLHALVCTILQRHGHGPRLLASLCYKPPQPVQAGSITLTCTGVRDVTRNTCRLCVRWQKSTESTCIPSSNTGGTRLSPQLMRLRLAEALEGEPAVLRRALWPLPSPASSGLLLLSRARPRLEAEPGDTALACARVVRGDAVGGGACLRGFAPAVRVGLPGAAALPQPVGRLLLRVGLPAVANVVPLPLAHVPSSAPPAVAGTAAATRAAVATASAVASGASAATVAKRPACTVSAPALVHVPAASMAAPMPSPTPSASARPRPSFCAHKRRRTRNALTQGCATKYTCFC